MKPRRTVIGGLALVVATAGFVLTGISSAPAAGPIGYTSVNVTGGGCRIATVDIGTGTTTLLSAPATDAACVNDLAVAPDGGLWGVDDAGLKDGLSVLLVHFDPTTGAIIGSGTITGSFTNAHLVFGGITFDSKGVMKVHLVTDQTGCDDEFVCLYTVDPTTRVATFVGSSGQLETEMSFLTADCAGSMVTAEGAPPGVIAGVQPRSTIDGPTTTTSDAPDTKALSGWVTPQNGLVSQQLGIVNTSSGVVTRGAIIVPFFFDLLGLSYNPVTGVLYALGEEIGVPPVVAGGTAAEIVDDIGVYTVDPVTGVTNRVADFDEGATGFPRGFAIGGSCATNLVAHFTG